MLHELSSQFRAWRFSRSELVRARAAANADAAARAREAQRIEAELAEAEGAVEASTPLSTSLSPSEEMTLLLYYQSKIQLICELLGYSDNIMATAIFFIKRFYLNTSVTDYHPKNITLACIYLAAKTDDRYFPVDEFVSHIPNADSKVILDLEFVVLRRLKFHLVCHNAYLPLYGLFLDLQSIITDQQIAEEIYTEARGIVKTSLLTDVCFIFQPSQIALAAYFMAAKKHGIDLDSYIQTKLLDAEHSSAIELTAMLEDIESEIRAFNMPQEVLMKEIDKKLALCKNQATNPESRVYKRLAEHQLVSEEEKRSKKLAIQQEADDLAMANILQKPILNN